MYINGEYLEVVIERKKIKNIYFRINDDNQIYVTCPKYVSEKEINKLLEDNIKALERMDKKNKNNKNSLEKVLYLGQELDYVYYKKIMFEGNMAFGPSVDAINEYLEKKALEEFERILDEWLPKFSNLPKFRLRIRKMKSRWGVCNKKSMTITLNSQLIHKKKELIEYVIVHELSHFYYMDHSTNFWKCVEKYYPNYKSARKELRG